MQEFREDKRSSPAAKRVWRVLRIGILLALLAAGVTFAVQVVSVMIPRMKTQVVELAEMTDGITLEGFVALESTPVEGRGVLYYTVPAGQRVSKGSEVAKVFTSEAAAQAMADLERVQAELALLEEAQGTMADGGDMDGFLRQQEEGLHQYLDVLETGRYSSVAATVDEMTLAANKLQIATGEAADFSARIEALRQREQSLLTQTAAAASVEAPETGFFVPSYGQDRVPLSAEVLDALSAGNLLTAMAEPAQYYGDEVGGHIVSDYKWRFYTVVEGADIERFSEGMKLEILFPDASEERMPVVVESLVPDEDESRAKLVVVCEYNNPDVLRLRLETAQLVFSTQKGLRVDKNAVRVIEGQRCVYVKFGNQVFRRNIEVLLENENEVLLPNLVEKDINEVRLYDEVVVDSGGEELYDQKIL